jgi:hypothetical protein
VGGLPHASADLEQAGGRASPSRGSTRTHGLQNVPNTWVTLLAERIIEWLPRLGFRIAIAISELICVRIATSTLRLVPFRRWACHGFDFGNEGAFQLRHQRPEVLGNLLPLVGVADRVL